MFCNTCTSNPCACRAKRAGTSVDGETWLISHCAAPHCDVAIRHRADDPTSTICKWHQRGTAINPSAYPPGMPDPECPWPWQTDQERERRVRLPEQQARFRRYPALYAKWLIDQPVTVPA